MKKNIFIAVGAAVVLVMVGVVGFLLYGEISRFNDAKGKLDMSIGMLRKFYGNKPFPNAENVQREQKNVQVTKQWFQKLVEDLRKDETKVVQVSPAILLTILTDTKKALVEEAKKRGTHLPATFHFGFDRYALGDLPAPTDVTRLNEQLLVVAALCQVLFEEGAASLAQVTREEFEEQRGSGSGAASGGPASGRTTTRGPKAAAEAKPPVGLYMKQRFTLDFKAKEAAVANIINRLAELGSFAAVCSVELQNEGVDVKPAPSGVGEAGKEGEAKDKGDGETASEDKGIAKEKSKSAEDKGIAKEKSKSADKERLLSKLPTRSERVVSGPALEAALKVRLEVDVYRFAQESVP